MTSNCFENERAANAPSHNRHKLALLTWVAVYPTIVILLSLLEPVISNLPLPVRSLILSATMVPMMVYMAMPKLTARYRRWLSR